LGQTNDILSMPIREFAATTAAKTPTPGGGSVAGVVGSLAVALGEMSLNFTRGKKKFAEHESLYEHLARRLARTREMFEGLVADDIAAYTLYQQTTQMPDGAEKESQMHTALAAAINVPREMSKLALSLEEDLLALSDKCSRWLVSDLVAAAALAVAVVQMSDYNVRINAPNLPASDQADEIRQASRDDLEKARRLHQQIDQSVKEHLP